MDDRRRDPADPARLSASALALIAMVGLIMIRPESLHNVSVEVIRLAAVLPDSLQTAIVGTTQLLALCTAVGLVVAVIIWRRWSVLVPAMVSAAIAAGLSALVTDRVSSTLPAASIHLPRPSWLIGESFPSSSYLAAVTAAVITLSPTWNRKWRRAAWIGVGLVASSRLLTAVAPPVGILAAIVLGMTVGWAMLSIFGVARLRPDPRQITDAIRRLGIPVTSVRPASGSTGTHSRFIADPDNDDLDERIEILLVDKDDRDADLFARFVRRIRVRGDADDRAGMSADRMAGHTAMITMLAQNVGASVGRVVGIGELDPGTHLVVMRTPVGERMGDLSPEDIPDGAIRRAWQSLCTMHVHRIAHGRAACRNVIVTPHGDAIWTRFRFGAVSAADAALTLDTAEFLISTAIAVGPERAVTAAMAEVPRDALTAALPMMQPIALSPGTRRELGRKNDLVDHTRDMLQERIGAESVELAPLQRITAGRLGILALITILTYVALSFGSDLSKISQSLSEFSLAYLPALVFFAALTYPLLAVSTMGAAPITIPFGQMSLVALAQSLLNKFTPANAGGMALRVRYLQRSGMDVEAAATTLGLTSAFSGVAQIIVLVIFGIWAGSSGDLSFSLPTSMIAPAIVVLSVGAGVFYLTPWGRRIWYSRLRPSLDRAWPVVRDLFRSPGRLSVLLAANLADKLSTIAAFAISLNAIGIHSSFAQMGFLYMTANTVAGAAPTPGGIGAIEAALTAALTATGVPTAEALSAVLVFRLATFWVPIPFGGIALARVRKKGLV